MRANTEIPTIAKGQTSKKMGERWVNPVNLSIHFEQRHRSHPKHFHYQIGDTYENTQYLERFFLLLFRFRKLHFLFEQFFFNRIPEHLIVRTRMVNLCPNDLKVILRAD